MYKRFYKRIIDFVLSTLAIIVASPVIGLLTLAVRIDVGKPALFKQERTGKNRKKFFILKFRTMTNQTDSQGRLLPDHDRVTRVGKFLRSTSLDELPELFNIFMGDMSIVGPRPLPTKYDEYYRNEELDRFMVRGGLIPPDSVDNNPIISWDRQFEYEANYARNCSLLEDIRIILGAFRIVLRRSKSNYGTFERRPLNIERQKVMARND